MSKKKLNGEQIFSLMSDIDPKLLAEAVPPSWVSDGGRMPAKEKKHPFAWLDSGWAAAILSVIVSVAVLVAIVMAGQMGTGDPVGGTIPESETPPETGTTFPEDTEPYTLQFVSNGDGTCIVVILVNDKNTKPYGVVIPEKSPMGDTVTAVKSTFNTHILLPRVMTADGFETYIKAPMEAHFGVTVEEAESMKFMKPDATDSRYVAGFELRKYLAYFLYRSESMLSSADAEAPELGLAAIDTDIYLLELTVTDEEIRDLSALLALVGFTAESWEAINRDLVAHGAPVDTYPEDIVLSAGIETLTLPATLRELPDGMFDSWKDLTRIVFEGTVEQWNTVTRGAWAALVEVQCADGIIRVGGEIAPLPETETFPVPDIEPVLSMSTIAVDVPGRESVYVQGTITHCDYMEDGERIGWDAAIAWIGDYVHMPGVVLSTVTVPQSSAASIRYLPRDGWEYSFSATVYDEAFTDSTDHAPASTDDFAFLTDRPAGVYYAELWVKGNTPLTEEAPENDTYEYANARYIFRLIVTGDPLESGPPPFAPLPTVNTTTLYMETHGHRSVYLPGYVHWAEEYMDGYIASADMVYPSRAELIAAGLPELSLPAGQAPTVVHGQYRDYTYRMTASVYDAEDAEGDSLYWLEASDDKTFDTFSTLPVGVYVVELSLVGTGSRSDGEGNYEGACVVFTFRLRVIEPDDREPTLNSTTMSVKDKNGETVYIPGQTASYAEVYQAGDDPPELMEISASLESIEGLVNDEMVGVTCTMRNFNFETTEGWTYERRLTVYDAELNEVISGGTHLIGSVGNGTYYVEIMVRGDGPHLPEFDGNEYYVTIFTFRLTLENDS